MTSLETLFPLIDSALWHGFAVFLRVAALTSLMPGFGERTVSTRVKLSIAFCFTLVIAPAVPISAPPDTMMQAVRIILTETVAGLILGVGLRLFILALQTAGSIAAQSTSLSQVLGGAAADPLPAISYILVVAGLALAVSTGLHVKAAYFVIFSYNFIPFGDFSPSTEVTDWGVHQIAKAFSLAFTLAAPFVVLSVLYNFALGAINRAMPQLMVAFVGAPLITFGGLALLLISAPYMLTVWIETMDRFLLNPLEID